MGLCDAFEVMKSSIGCDGAGPAEEEIHVCCTTEYGIEHGFQVFQITAELMFSI